MKLIGIFFWLIFGGLLTSALWFLAGLLLCLTIIGIPFGIRCIKVAGFIWSPFEKEIDVLDFGEKGFLKHLIWLGLVGIELTGAHLIFGLLSAITIIGMPFAKKHFELAGLALSPFRS